MGDIREECQPPIAATMIPTIMRPQITVKMPPMTTPIHAWTLPLSLQSWFRRRVGGIDVGTLANVGPFLRGHCPNRLVAAMDVQIVVPPSAAVWRLATKRASQ